MPPKVQELPCRPQADTKGAPTLVLPIISLGSQEQWLHFTVVGGPIPSQAGGHGHLCGVLFGTLHLLTRPSP